MASREELERLLSDLYPQQQEIPLAPGITSDSIAEEQSIQEVQQLPVPELPAPVLLEPVRGPFANQSQEQIQSAPEAIQAEQVEEIQKIVQADNAPKEEVNPLDQMTYNEMMNLGGPAKAEEQLKKLSDTPKNREPALERKQGLLEENDRVSPKSESADDKLKKAEWLDAMSSIAGTLNFHNKGQRTPQTQFAKSAREEKLKKEKAENERFKPIKVGSTLLQLNKDTGKYESLYTDKTSGEKRTGIMDTVMKDGKPTRLLIDKNSGEIIKDFGKAVRDTRLQEKDDWRRQEKDELSDKQVETITAFDSGNDILDKIETLIPSVEKDLGVYASKIEEGKKYIPFMERNESYVKTQQLVGTQLANYVKSISGAQVSEEEAQRLLKNIPNMDDKPNEFKVKLDTFRGLLNEYKKRNLDNIKKQGKNVDSFTKKSSTKKEESPKKEPTSDQIKKYSEMYKLPEDQAKQILIKRLNR